MLNSRYLSKSTISVFWVKNRLESKLSNSFKIAVLISGGGTTLKNLIALRRNGALSANIVQVISSNPNAGGNALAVDFDVSLEIVQRREFETTEQFSAKIFDICRTAQVDLVVMGGFLKKVNVPNDYTNRVINIHPSLIPAFSGQGFYGLKVHQAVIQYGCKVSGCTVHFVDNEYDHGPVIAQESLQVSPSDTPESLQSRVFQLECSLYPRVINAIAAGKLSINSRTVTITD